MEKENRKTARDFLPWPWNAVVYVLLAVLLRIFSIPVILILMYVRKKKNPGGGSEGYCLARSRGGLTGLLWALLWLFIAVSLGVYSCVEYSEMRAGAQEYGMAEYAKTLLAGAAAAAFLAGGVYTAFTAVRDCFFPEKSALAQSIRRQLPYPDEAPPVRELFAMVDNDLRENGQWFGRLGIGKEWVLGSTAMRIDRIRGIFTVDEIRWHSTQTGPRTSRTIELALVDNRWQCMTTGFTRPGDMRAAADCLALRVPDAVRGTNGQYISFLNTPESERDEFELRFRQKQNRRASEQLLRGNAGSAAQTQDMILRDGNGATSRVTQQLVSAKLRECVSGSSEGFSLTPTRPVQSNAGPIRAMHVKAAGNTVYLTAETAGTPGQGLEGVMDEYRACELLELWLEKKAPDLTGWTPYRFGGGAPAREAPERRSAARLALLYASGAGETHTTFTAEDVQIAAEGIVDGSYQAVDLTLPNGYMWIRVKAGGKTDGRCTVEATRPDGGHLDFYTARMSPRRAAAWLTGYPHGEYIPGGKDWKKCAKRN